MSPADEMVLEDMMDPKILSSEDYMLTTRDNPYNPFEQWDQWVAFDEKMEYFTCGLLARFSKDSSEEHENIRKMEIRRAMIKVLMYRSDIYMIVTEGHYIRKRNPIKN